MSLAHGEYDKYAAKLKTRICPASLNPKWNDEFKISVIDKKARVVFKVAAFKSMSQNVPLGTCELALEDAKFDTQYDTSLRLKDAPCGELTIQYQLKEPGVAPKFFYKILPHLRIETERAIYFAGEKLTGCVKLNVGSSMALSSATVSLEGHQEALGHRIPIITSDKVVWGEEHGSDKVLKDDIYSWPFTFKLPSLIPPSYEGRHSTCIYAVNVRLKGRDAQEIQRKLKVRVHHHAQSQPETYTVRFKEHDVSLVATLKSPVAYIGEPNVMFFYIDNHSRREIKTARFSVIQSVKYMTTSQTMVKDKELVRAPLSTGFPIPSMSESNQTIAFKIPPGTLPTLLKQKASPLVQIYYKLEIVCIFTSSSLKVRLESPVVIGNRIPVRVKTMSGSPKIIKRDPTTVNAHLLHKKSLKQLRTHPKVTSPKLKKKKSNKTLRTKSSKSSRSTNGFKRPKIKHSKSAPDLRKPTDVSNSDSGSESPPFIVTKKKRPVNSRSKPEGSKTLRTPRSKTKSRRGSSKRKKRSKSPSTRTAAESQPDLLGGAVEPAKPTKQASDLLLLELSPQPQAQPSQSDSPTETSNPFGDLVGISLQPSPSLSSSNPFEDVPDASLSQDAMGSLETLAFTMTTDDPNAAPSSPNPLTVSQQPQQTPQQEAPVNFRHRGISLSWAKGQSPLDGFASQPSPRGLRTGGGMSGGGMSFTASPTSGGRSMGFSTGPPDPFGQPMSFSTNPASTPRPVALSTTPLPKIDEPPPPSNLSQIMKLGYTEKQAQVALNATNDDFAEAVAFLQSIAGVAQKQ